MAYSTKGITLAGARYASEDAAVLVHYAICILDYNRLLGPYRASKEKLESIKQEQIKYEREKQEKEAEVIFNFNL